MEQEKSMPPPQSPGISRKRLFDPAVEGAGQVNGQVPADQSVLKKTRGSEVVEGTLDSTPPFDIKPTNNILTIWKDNQDQLLKELETMMVSWSEELRLLQEKEDAALGRIYQLLKSSREMNICFHHQLDNLHNTVVNLVSSFKK